MNELEHRIASLEQRRQEYVNLNSDRPSVLETIAQIDADLVRLRTTKDPNDLHRAKWEHWWTTQSRAAHLEILIRLRLGTPLSSASWDDLPAHMRGRLLAEPIPYAT